MKQVSSWIATMTFVFWGMLGAGLLVHALSPNDRQVVAYFYLPLTAVPALAALLFHLRRRAARQKKALSLEELRRLSRQRLAGEPDEGAYVVLPSRRRHREAPCDQGQERQSVEENPAAPANEHMQSDKQNHPANGSWVSNRFL